MGKGLTPILREKGLKPRRGRQIENFYCLCLEADIPIPNAPETIKESADTNSTKVN